MTSQDPTTLDRAAPQRIDRRTVARVGGLLVGMAVASLLLGGATSFGQTVLPGPVNSLANSVSGWTLVTAVLVVLARQRTLLSAALGLLGFVGLVLGYQIVSTLRGYPDNATFLLIAILSGPVVGVASCWIRGRDLRAALAVGVLSGIGLGDAASGLARVAATTGWVYWTLIGLAATAVFALIAVRLTRGRDRAIAAAATVAVAGALYLFELLY